MSRPDVYPALAVALWGSQSTGWPSILGGKRPVFSGLAGDSPLPNRRGWLVALKQPIASGDLRAIHHHALTCRPGDYPGRPAAVVIPRSGPFAPRHKPDRPEWD